MNPSIRQRFRSRIVAGVCFWERGRVLYNGLQLVLTAVMMVVRWPESHFLYSSHSGEYLYYALIANILYTTAYVPELILQLKFFRSSAGVLRWATFLVGTSFACCLAFIALDADVLRPPYED